MTGRCLIDRGSWMTGYGGCRYKVSVAVECDVDVERYAFGDSSREMRNVRMILPRRGCRVVGTSGTCWGVVGRYIVSIGMIRRGMIAADKMAKNSSVDLLE